MAGSARGGRALRALIARVDSFDSAEAALRHMEPLGRTGPAVISFFNQHAANLAAGQPVFARDLAAADLLLRDGIGVKLACAVLGRRAGANLNGTDFIPRLLAARRGCRILLCGTEEPWLSRAADRLARDGHRLVGTLSGFEPAEAYYPAIAAARPEIVVLGMGMPRQERVAACLQTRLPFPCLIVNGGAILDFLADRHPRAPQPLRRIGLEWLYRLSREPRRLARRYLIGIPVFFAHLMEPGRPILDEQEPRS